MTFFQRIKKYLFTEALFLLFPATAFAVTAPGSLKEFAQLAVKVLQGITGLIFASLVIGLMYGVVRYMISGESERIHHEIKELLLWGVIGIIVVMGLWGILAILGQSVFGTGAVGIPQITAPTN